MLCNAKLSGPEMVHFCNNFRLLFCNHPTTPKVLVSTEFLAPLSHIFRRKHLPAEGMDRMNTLGQRLGQYNYPNGDGRIEFWYKCGSRKCDVYLLFAQPHRSEQEIRRAMQYAYDKQAT